MIAVISPAKTLDFESDPAVETTQPRFKKQALELVEVMKTKSPADIRDLMDVSENLAELNADRYRKFKKRVTSKNSKPCGFAFKGDVYIGLEAENFNDDDIDFAQGHLRILSGLYGLLRPLDLIQPYRLEMGTQLAFDDYNTLYDYWGDRIVRMLHKDLKAQGDNVLINLASNEYFKSIERKSLKANVIDVEFKDLKNDEYKIISFYAKKARGMMSRFIVKNQLQKPEDLKSFNYSNYWFDENESSEKNLVFKRD
ncbi:MAG: peroxide stress protein YaaA [Cyclobacteriaceae bacterium]